MPSLTEKVLIDIRGKFCVRPKTIWHFEMRERKRGKQQGMPRSNCQGSQI